MKTPAQIAAEMLEALQIPDAGRCTITTNGSRCVNPRIKGQEVCDGHYVKAALVAALGQTVADMAFRDTVPTPEKMPTQPEPKPFHVKHKRGRRSPSAVSVSTVKTSR